MDHEITRVCIVTAGSRGDIQPFLLFAVFLLQLNQLQPRNHLWKPIMVTAHNYAHWITENGIEFRPLKLTKETDVDAVMSSHELVEAIATGNTIRSLELINEPPEEEDATLEAIDYACRDANVIISNDIVMPKVITVAEKYGIPVGLWFSYPNRPTHEFPHPVFPWPSFRLWNKLTHIFFHALMFYGTKHNIKRWRDDAKLGAITSTSAFRQWIESFPAFFAYSPSIVPPPRDWNENAVVGGYIFDKNTGELTPEIRQFIDKTHDPSPVIYIGFGSMPVVLSQRFQHLINELDTAISKDTQKYRILLFTGKSTPGSHEHHLKLPDYILPIHTVPQNTLFPLCDFIFHHGGAGTTAAALRSGTPSMVVSVFVDQPFWGKRTRMALGRRAPKSIPFQKVTGEQLLKGIRRGLGLKREAEAVARVLEEEDGVGRAVRWLEGILATQDVAGNKT